MAHHKAAAAALLILCGSAAHGQLPGNPADAQRQTTSASGATTDNHEIAAEMEAIIIEGHRSSLHEEDRIGPNQQPRWTAFRRFPSTRIYVQPEGYVGVEQWYRISEHKHGEGTRSIAQTEIEFGLPHRMQLDLYLINRRDVPGAETQTDNAIELRYAFADWGKVWGNPTMYFELIQQDNEANKAEVKLLLGDEFREGWHWGTNFVWEYTMGDSKTREYEWTFGVSRTVRDDKFSLGVEAKVGIEDESGARGEWERDYRIGPSFQWRPMPRMHIDFAPLFGWTDTSKRADIYTIFGYEF